MAKKRKNNNSNNNIGIFIIILIAFVCICTILIVLITEQDKKNKDNEVACAKKLIINSMMIDEKTVNNLKCNINNHILKCNSGNYKFDLVYDNTTNTMKFSSYEQYNSSGYLIDENYIGTKLVCPR